MYDILRPIAACIVAVLCVTAPAFARQDGTAQEFLLEGDAAARAEVLERLESVGFPAVEVQAYAAFPIALHRFKPELSDDQLVEAREALAALTPDGGGIGGEFNSVLSVERGGGQTGSLWVTGLGAPEFDAQYGLAVTGGRIAADHATGLGVKVAIIDSGLVPGAPRAEEYALPRGYVFISGSAVLLSHPPSDLGDGSDNNGNTAIDEGVGHGTFIASLIALTAPGARHLHIKVLDDEGECELSDLLGALDACIVENVHVVNLSVVPANRTTMLASAFAALRQNGAIIVAAAGNQGTDTNPFESSEHDLVQVGATTARGAVWSQSSAGDWIDIMAPGATEFDAKGTPIAGERVIGVIGVNDIGEAQFAAASGTSFSAAFVTGAAACFRAANPSWPDDVAPEEIAGRFEAALDAGATPLEGSPFGLLDAEALVAGFTPVPRCPGDVVRASHGEGPEYRVDGRDLTALLARFGTVLTDPRRIERANLVRDGAGAIEVIDARDFLALLAGWGLQPQSPCP